MEPHVLSRLTARSLLGPSAAALVLLLVAGLLLQLSGLLLGSALIPGPGLLSLLVPALAPSALELALPVAFLVGLMAGYGRWHAEGTWIALRAAGLGGRRLVLPALIPAALVALLLATSTHLLAPAGRRAAARGLADAASAMELVPGRFVQAGEALLLRGDDGALLVASDRAASTARSGTLISREGGLLLRLEHGRIHGLSDQPLELDFATAEIPIPVTTSGRRVELAERSSAELAALVERMRGRGRDASYEHCVLLKRSTLPLVPLLLPLLALPLALRWGGRPSHSLLVVLGYWSLLRLGDLACHSIGAPLAACLPLLGLGLAAALLWLRWRDR